MALDPTSPIGKVRLRVGDYLDFPLLPDAVYQSELDAADGSVVRASKMVAQYILGMLTMRVHQKMAQLEVYGAEYSKNYIAFLQATILNPSLMEDAPIPYASGLDKEHPLIQFQKDWNANYVEGTASQQLHETAYPGWLNGWQREFV